MSCCPPNSEKFLLASYEFSGATNSTQEGVEYYVSGVPTEGKTAVLIISDVFGWNGGRTRSIADLFAEAGYWAVVPKLMVPALSGGTDGDGIPPTFNFGTQMAEFKAFLAQMPWEGKTEFSQYVTNCI